MPGRPPGPKGLPLLGNTYHYARDPFTFMTAVGRAYGDVAEVQLGRDRLVVLTDPDDVGRVLVEDADHYRKATFQDEALDRLLGDGLLVSEGETWRRRRDLVRPAFDRDRVRGLADGMVDRAVEMVDRWAAGDRVDVEREMARVTVAIIVDAMFGTTVDVETADEVGEALQPVGRRFEADLRRALVPSWLPTGEERTYRAAVETLDRVVADLVERRRAEGGVEDGDDLVATLLRAREAGRIDDDGLRDELVTTLLAGHDTTALALAYSLYLLSKHPGAAARLAAELDETLDGDRPTAGDLPELAYTERVVTEAMRLYPPVYALFRRPLGDERFDGYRVPAGTPLMLPQWVVHRDPAHYDDPEAFDPDRWTRERRADRHRFAYFPFGAGPRACIGRGFATTEAKLVLATVCQEYRLAYEGTEPLDLMGSITMHPRNEMLFRVENR